MNDNELYEGHSESDDHVQDELYSQPDDPTQDKLDEIHSTLEEIRDELPRVKTDIWGPFLAFCRYFALE